jgi:hypothetical protein
MVGAVIVACTLALAFGGDPSDSRVARGVMTEAVAYHVRTTDPRVQSWLELGAAESQTFRDLLRRLGESDLIVHVQVVDRLTVAGQTYIVASTGGVRYVRIEVVPERHARDTVALVGHELQHAVEIADAPQVRDRESLAQFYRLMPDNLASTGLLDSADARLMEDRVRREMTASEHPALDRATRALIAARNRDHSAESR